MSVARKLKVDVTSDYLCPFCLLGVKQFQLALAKYNDSASTPVDAQIEMHPFQLNPTIKEEPIPRSEYARARFGDEKWRAITDQLVRSFKDVGVDYKVDGQMSQSHLAHRLTAYARAHKPDVQLPLAMDIFDMYHVNGTHLSDRDELARIAVKHGLFADAAEAKAWLAGSDLNDEVMADYAKAQRAGISGVPAWRFNDKYAASGAIGVDGFVNVLEQIAAREGV